MISDMLNYMMHTARQASEFCVPARLLNKVKDAKLVNYGVLVKTEKLAEWAICPQCNGWHSVFSIGSPARHYVLCEEDGHAYEIPHAVLEQLELVRERLPKWFQESGVLRPEEERIFLEAFPGMDLVKPGEELPTKRCRRPQKSEGVDFNKLSIRISRFDLNPQKTVIRDYKHDTDDYPLISLYTGFNPESKPGKQILAYMRAARPNGGWLKPYENFRTECKIEPYHSFYKYQLEKGHKGYHLGYLRIYTDAEFDTLSPAGKYYERTQAEKRSKRSIAMP